MWSHNSSVSDLSADTSVNIAKLLTKLHASSTPSPQLQSLWLPGTTLIRLWGPVHPYSTHHCWMARAACFTTVLSSACHLICWDRNLTAPAPLYIRPPYPHLISASLRSVGSRPVGQKIAPTLKSLRLFQHLLCWRTWDRRRRRRNKGKTAMTLIDWWLDPNWRALRWETWQTAVTDGEVLTKGSASLGEITAEQQVLRDELDLG